jgi:hypothetical protein
MGVFAPRQIRKYRRFSNRMYRLCPWLWFGGIPTIFVTSLTLGHDSPWVLVACVLTIYPAIFIWLSLPAFEGLWKVLLRTPRTKSVRAWIAFAFILSISIVWTAFGVVLLAAAIWQLLAA